MRFIDNFLRRHGVDVGKTIGLLTITGAITSLYGMVGKVFAGNLPTLELGPPIEIVIGIALWNHRSWARKLAIVLGWLVAGTLLVMQLSMPLTGPAHFSLNLGSETISQPPAWMIIAWGILVIPPLFIFLGALYSETAGEEFKPRPRHFPTPPLNFFGAFLIIIFLGVIYGGALALNSAHTRYGESGFCLNGGSQFTPASDAYYRDATHALINHLSSSGFTAETPSLESGQPAPVPEGTYYFKRKDNVGGTLYLMIDSRLGNANNPTSPQYMIAVDCSYSIRYWNWEKRDFRDAVAICTGELRQWWIEYRRTHPTGFRDQADPRP